MESKSGLPQNVKDFLGGTFAGMASKIIEQPFDTVKVRLQTSGAYKGPMDCLVRVVRTEGITALFRGITAPLWGAAAANAVAFFTYEELKRQLSADDGSIDIGHVALAGGLAGLAISLVWTPVELVKCRQQTVGSQYRGSVDCMKKTYQQEGLRGFFKGHVPTMVREFPGCMVFFGAYEAVIRGMTPAEQQPSPLAIIVAGSTAGIGYWCSVFPVDTIKSRIQVATTHQSILGTAQQLIREGGVRKLYAGLGVTLVRAVPVNSSLFLVYDLVTRLL
eukprot:TRINITY_DN9810_c0_g1_i1.p1 TRINITY_DN9810_c0_g1~~TRINITY_DN9810_c0_g1_i1.p1  ORF type:complete len:276 (-),score=57.86 TRINITY_DN9810_c0_g1_i1:130-957(-)